MSADMTTFVGMQSLRMAETAARPFELADRLVNRQPTVFAQDFGPRLHHRYQAFGASDTLASTIAQRFATQQQPTTGPELILPQRASRPPAIARWMGSTWPTNPANAPVLASEPTIPAIRRAATQPAIRRAASQELPNPPAALPIAQRVEQDSPATPADPPLMDGGYAAGGYEPDAAPEQHEPADPPEQPESAEAVEAIPAPTDGSIARVLDRTLGTLPSGRNLAPHAIGNPTEAVRRSAVPVEPHPFSNTADLPAAPTDAVSRPADLPAVPTDAVSQSADPPPIARNPEPGSTLAAIDLTLVRPAALRPTALMRQMAIDPLARMGLRGEQPVPALQPPRAARSAAATNPPESAGVAGGGLLPTNQQVLNRSATPNPPIHTSSDPMRSVARASDDPLLDRPMIAAGHEPGSAPITDLLPASAAGQTPIEMAGRAGMTGVSFEQPGASMQLPLAQPSPGTPRSQAQREPESPPIPAAPAESAAKSSEESPAESLPYETAAPINWPVQHQLANQAEVPFANASDLVAQPNEPVPAIARATSSTSDSLATPIGESSASSLPFVARRQAEPIVLRRQADPIRRAALPLISAQPAPELPFGQLLPTSQAPVLNQLDRHATPLIARQSSEWMPTLNDTAWMPTSTSAADQQPGSGSAIAPGAAPLPLMRSIAANTFLPTETASIAMREAVWAQNDSPRHTELTYGPTIGALIRRLTSSTEGSALDEPVFEATEDQAEPRAAYSELALARPVAAEVQRAFSSLQRASATEPAAPASAQASAGKTNAAQPPSIEQISQQVYDYLRRRLAIDRERLNGGF